MRSIRYFPQIKSAAFRKIPALSSNDLLSQSLCACWLLSIAFRIKDYNTDSQQKLFSRMNTYFQLCIQVCGQADCGLGQERTPANVQRINLEIILVGLMSAYRISIIKLSQLAVSVKRLKNKKPSDKCKWEGESGEKLIFSASCKFHSPWALLCSLAWDFRQPKSFTVACEGQITALNLFEKVECFDKDNQFGTSFKDHLNFQLFQVRLLFVCFCFCFFFLNFFPEDDRGYAPRTRSVSRPLRIYGTSHNKNCFKKEKKKRRETNLVPRPVKTCKIPKTTTFTLRLRRLTLFFFFFHVHNESMKQTHLDLKAHILGSYLFIAYEYGYIVHFAVVFLQLGFEFLFFFAPWEIFKNWLICCFVVLYATDHGRGIQPGKGKKESWHDPCEALWKKGEVPHLARGVAHSGKCRA